MAASFNKVILVGNLTRDPEIRYVNSGSAVTKFRIAVNPNKRDAKPEDTMYVDIVAWERLAETCNTYLKKGSPVLVEGRLKRSASMTMPSSATTAVSRFVVRRPR